MILIFDYVLKLSGMHEAEQV